MGTTSTPLEAAVAQLDAAIKLWFQGEDLIPVCTLTHAAWSYFRRKGKIKGVEKFFDHPISPELTEALEQVRLEVYSGEANFFKHGGADSTPLIHYDAQATFIMMWESVLAYRVPGNPIIPSLELFIAWMAKCQPKFFPDDDFSDAARLKSINTVFRPQKKNFFRWRYALFKRGFSGRVYPPKTV